MMGLVLAKTPVLSVYVVKGTVVPLAYVYSLPPTNGIPAAVKNCIFGEGVSVTA
jgi:hypothetical protein